MYVVGRTQNLQSSTVVIARTVLRTWAQCRMAITTASIVAEVKHFFVKSLLSSANASNFTRAKYML